MIQKLILIFRHRRLSIRETLSFVSEKMELLKNHFSVTFQYSNFYVREDGSYHNIIELKNFYNEDFYFDIEIQQINDDSYLELTIDSKNFQQLLFDDDLIEPILNHLIIVKPNVNIYYSFDGLVNLEAIDEDVIKSIKKVEDGFNSTNAIREIPSVVKLYPKGNP